MCVVCDFSHIDTRTILSVSEFQASRPTLTDATIAAQALSVATKKIERYLGRKLFYFKNAVEYMDSKGAAFLQLRRAPVYQIHRVEYLDCVCCPDACCDDAYTLKDFGKDGYIGLTNGWPVTSGYEYNSISQSKTLTPSTPRIKVVYSGGFALQSEIDDSCVDCVATLPDADGDECTSLSYPDAITDVQVMPEDLKLACLIEATRVYQSVSSLCDNSALLSESFADRSVSYLKPNEDGKISGLSKNIQDLIKHYRFYSHF